MLHCTVIHVSLVDVCLFSNLMFTPFSSHSLTVFCSIFSSFLVMILPFCIFCNGNEWKRFCTKAVIKAKSKSRKKTRNWKYTKTTHFFFWLDFVMCGENFEECNRCMRHQNWFIFTSKYTVTTTFNLKNGF